jgi:hypothetical protein
MPMPIVAGTAETSTSDSTSGSTTGAGATATGPSANFTVSAAGGFVDPNGHAWTMRGLNAGVQDALQGFANLLKDYPGLTAIRLNVNPAQDSTASIDQVVQEYTKAGIVVEIEDHSGSQTNVPWYQQLAQAYANNPLVFLEMPNEPGGTAQQVAQNDIAIINAIRAAGFTNPIGLQPDGGFDQSDIPIVTAAEGKTSFFVTPHIYYGGTDPNGASQFVASEIGQAQSNGLFAAIDEFGDAIDGFTLDPQGMTTISAIEAANEAGNAGAIFWAMDNGNHPDGADSAFLTTDGSQLTPIGVQLQSWLTGGGQVVFGASTTGGTTTGGTTTHGTTGGTAGGTTAGGATGGGTGGTPSPVLVTPGNGSVTGAAGNVNTNSAPGDADHDGQSMNGGTNTDQSGAVQSMGPNNSTLSDGTSPKGDEVGDHGPHLEYPSQIGGYTVGSDTYVLTNDDAVAALLGTGTSEIQFTGTNSFPMSGAPGQGTLTAAASATEFFPGTGTLEAAAGSDTDTLTMDKALLGSLAQEPDRQDGTILGYGAGAERAVDTGLLVALPTT